MFVQYTCILWKICSVHIRQNLYQYASDAFFSICTYIYMRATTFIYSFHVLRMYIVQYVQSILLFWTRMKSMRILGRDNVVAHQTHFKPSNLTIFSSMDLKIHLTQRKWSATRQFLQHLQNTHKINSKIIVITLMFRFCL